VAVDNQDVRWFAMLGVVLLAVLLYALLPRYEWKMVGDERSISIVVYDKWTGRMQRAVYDDSGSLNVMGPYMPFQK
jgi:hypothetical protein